MSEAPQVYKAIAEVMGELSKVGIKKDQKNSQQNYKFRGIDDVYNALAPLLSAHNLLILPRTMKRTPTERQTKGGGTLFHVVLEMEFDFISAMDGSKHTVAVTGEAMDTADKATNKAMSAAYKYACIEAFCIPTEGDEDADKITHELAPKKLDEMEYGLIEGALKEAQNPEALSGVLNTKLNPALPRMSEDQKAGLRKVYAARLNSVTQAPLKTNGQHAHQ